MWRKIKRQKLATDKKHIFNEAYISGAQKWPPAHVIKDCYNYYKVN